MAFAQKMLSFEFKLQNGQAATKAGSGSSFTKTNLRASVKVENAGAPQMGMLEADIYGMTLDEMNSLSTVGTQMSMMNQNSITVTADDGAGDVGIIFGGTINFAYADLRAQPDGHMHISAHAGYYEAGKKDEAVSLQGSQKSSNIAKQIADKNGWEFEDAGVTSSVNGAYYKGTGRNQMKQLSQAGQFNWVVENNKLIIAPTDKTRSGDSIILSKSTGMVSYPMFSQAGIIVQCYHKSSMGLYKGITVQSQITPANGNWRVNKLGIECECLTPKGKWFDTLEASRVGDDGGSTNSDGQN